MVTHLKLISKCLTNNFTLVFHLWALPNVPNQIKLCFITNNIKILIKLVINIFNIIYLWNILLKLINKFSVNNFTLVLEVLSNGLKLIKLHFIINITKPFIKWVAISLNKIWVILLKFIHKCLVKLLTRVKFLWFLLNKHRPWNNKIKWLELNNHKSSLLVGKQDNLTKIIKIHLFFLKSN